MRIGRYASLLITADDFTYFDAGTTMGCIIDFITKKQASVVTNSFYHAKQLSQSGFYVYIRGGEIKQPTKAAIGAETVKSPSKYRFTKSFTAPNVNEILVKKNATDKTLTKYIPCDPSKFSPIICVTFSPFSDAHIITMELAQSAYKTCTNITGVDNL